MKILIACEFSGIVREAFRAKGHQVCSCDLVDTDIPGEHYKGNVFDIINDGWDMMIAFPPCTYLTVSGNRSFLNNPDRWEKRLHALKFVHSLMNANINKICIENPKGVISTHIRKPDQYIEPYYFGHKGSKKTGLWLKNLPVLLPTEIVEPVWKICDGNGKRYNPEHWNTASSNNPDNAKKRSVTYTGIAKAMADQWGATQQIYCTHIVNKKHHTLQTKLNI